MIWHARRSWVVVTVLLAACNLGPNAEEAPAKHVEVVQVVRGNLEISAEVQQILYGVVAVTVCAETVCTIDTRAGPLVERPAVVINDFGVGPEATGRVLPPLVKAAVVTALGDVTFEHPGAFEGDLALLFAPIQVRRHNLVSIMAGHLCGVGCGRGREHYFLLHNDLGDGLWLPVTAEEAGVPNAVIQWES